MSSEADLKDLKEQLGKTVDTYVKYIDVDTGATVRLSAIFVFFLKIELIPDFF